MAQARSTCSSWTKRAILSQGQDVAAHFSDAQGRDTVHHQYSDIKGHVEFVREHAAEPLRVTFFVRGQSCGPYTIENGAKYTVEISRE